LAVLLGIGFPFAIIYPFFDEYVVKHLAVELQVSFDFTNGFVFSSAAFNANVVSTGFILGYITQKLPVKKGIEN
jgi:hypothetical protein